jgi:hypothetical protein
MFKILKGETYSGSGQQTLIFDPESKKHYVVNTVRYNKNDPEKPEAAINHNETLIYIADDKGNVNPTAIVWAKIPGDHDNTLNKLLTGELTQEQFDIAEDGKPYVYGGNN